MLFFVYICIDFIAFLYAAKIQIIDYDRKRIKKISYFA